MPLNNFGSILNFAENIEKQNFEFFNSAEQFSSHSDFNTLFNQLSTNSKKKIIEIQRTRRENISEMILENITDFYRQEFLIDIKSTKVLTIEQIIKTAIILVERSVLYYEKASKKLERQPEVSRILKTMGKKHKLNLKKLNEHV